MQVMPEVLIGHFKLTAFQSGRERAEHDAAAAQAREAKAREKTASVKSDNSQLKVAPAFAFASAFVVRALQRIHRRFLLLSLSLSHAPTFS